MDDEWKREIARVFYGGAIPDALCFDDGEWGSAAINPVYESAEDFEINSCVVPGAEVVAVEFDRRIGVDKVSFAIAYLRRKFPSVRHLFMYQNWHEVHALYELMFAELGLVTLTLKFSQSPPPLGVVRAQFVPKHGWFEVQHWYKQYHDCVMVVDPRDRWGLQEETMHRMDDV